MASKIYLRVALFYILSIFSLVRSSTFSPARPPSIPLAVRSPYLSTWLQVGKDGGDGGLLAGQWPTFWNGAATGWTGIVRVDGTAYTWMGNPVGPARVTQTAFEYTSTRSIFTQRVSGVELTVTFFSPVTPKNLVVSSIVSSYMTVAIRSIDGQKHRVQLYTDVSGEWVSGDRSSHIKWDYGVIKAKSSPKQKRHAPIDELEADIAMHSDERQAQTELADELEADVHPIYETAGHTHSHLRRDVNPGAGNATTVDADLTASASAVQKRAVAGGIAYHHFQRRQQLQFAEFNDQTQYGQWYYMAKNTNKLTHQSGADTNVRGRFISKGNLANTKDANYRAIQDKFPVFAYAINLGTVGRKSISNTFTISLSQREAIKFQGAKSTGNLPALWTSYFSDALSANAWFYNQHSTNLANAKTLDTKIRSDSINAGGSNYAAITALAVRQAFGSLQLTGSPGNPKLFMKEISSDGNVNTVDVIFPFHPIALYLEPKLLKYLLEPLLVNQEAGHWPYKFSIHDIGSRYPNATGHPDGNAEQQPLEECGDMMIMALAYAQRANDTPWLKKHYKIFKQWNSYLIDEALIPANQLSTDDFAGPIANSTNAALKGIIGIKAMAQIAKRTGHPKDATRFATIATNYMTQWEKYAVNKTGRKHTSLHYGFPSSWSLLYNLFADRLLKLDLVPQRIYDMQSAWYAQRANKYGVPLDGRHTYTKVDWEIFCAAVASKSTRAMIINRVAAWINQTPTNRAFTDWYDTVTGDFAGGFQNRPVVGGVFALLALR